MNAPSFDNNIYIYILCQYVRRLYTRKSGKGKYVHFRIRTTLSGQRIMTKQRTSSSSSIDRIQLSTKCRVGEKFPVIWYASSSEVFLSNAESDPFHRPLSSDDDDMNFSNLLSTPTEFSFIVTSLPTLGFSWAALHLSLSLRVSDKNSFELPESVGSTE
jgi:hypothetical protein